jgi:hypothetical protein
MREVLVNFDWRQAMQGRRLLNLTLLTVLLIVTVLITGASGCTVPSNITSTDKATTSQTTPSDAIRLTALELNRDYTANEIAGDNKYLGKTVEITGIISDIGKIIGNTDYYVALNDKKVEGQILLDFRPLVMCHFANAKGDILAKLSKGQLVTIRGKCTGLAGCPQVEESEVR